MEILTPTEASLESSSAYNHRNYWEDIDTEHVHAFARRPIRSEILVRCVRSTSARLENTMWTIRDGGCATVAPVLSLGCSVVSVIRHLRDGTSTCAAGRRQTPERSVRNHHADEYCIRISREIPRAACPDRKCRDGVLSARPPSHGTACRYGGSRWPCITVQGVITLYLTGVGKRVDHNHAMRGVAWACPMPI